VRCSRRLPVSIPVSILVSVLVLGGCAGSHPVSNPVGTTSPVRPPATTPTTSPAPLSAEIVLPRNTMRAGSSMPGHVVVENRTGHPLNEIGCGSLFQVALTSPTYQPQMAWPACAQRITVPVGRSTYRVTVVASYLGCTNGPPSTDFPPCRNGGLPPLPTGSYDAKLYQSGKIVPQPPTIPVQVTS